MEQEKQTKLDAAVKQLEQHKEQKREISLGPSEITPNNVLFWSEHWEELKGEGYANKAKLFFNYKCIKYVGDDPLHNTDGTFLCLPLNEESQWEERGRIFEKLSHPFYNKTVYRMRQEGGKWKCSCQGWDHKEKRNEGREDGVQCSHVLALFIFFKLSKLQKTAYLQFKNEEQQQEAIA